MGEVEEQKFPCKFCNKICISGKSLGGHMRCHLALIAAARKSKRKADNNNNIDFEDVNGDDDHHGDSGLEEKNLNVAVNFSQSQSIKNWAHDEGENSTMNLEIEDQDQENHVLRQNPKKSWKNSDLKIKPCQTKSNSCRECGKEFLSPRALAGHMRTHSNSSSTLSVTKSKDKHECSKCDRIFESRNSLYGHMKTHSNKSRISAESDSCLSDFEFYHPKKKRSITRYRTNQTFPFSGENEPSSVNEIDELDEEAAISLIMLSRGLRDHDVFNTNQESLCDIDEDGIPILALNSCVLVSPNSKPNHNSPEFFYSIDKKTDQDEQKCIDTDFETFNGSDKKREYKCKICKMIFKSHQALGGHSNRHKMMITTSSSPDDDAMIYDLSENPCNEIIQNKEHECQICFKIFPTGKALGGHKRAHYNRQIDNQDLEDIQPILDLNLPVITHMDTTRTDDIESSSRLTEFVHQCESMALAN